MSTRKLLARIIEELKPGLAVVELTSEPGVRWTAMKKGHLTLLRRHDEHGSGTTQSPQEVRRILQGTVRKETDS